ncbi:MAG: helix-turn-helix domain-containing protein, partial [Bacteroidota bacterium]
NEYVNTWRVKEVQQLLKEPQNQKYTLLSIALEAGFNSKSSFNRAVKKHLGISPSELKTFSEDSIS